MDLGLSAARVLVTGGASNIGRGIVHGFAAEGARVLICDIDAEQAAKVQAEALERGAAAAEVAIADLAAAGAAHQVVQRATELWGGLDVLVNNAGWTRHVFLAEHTDRAEWQRLVDVNLFAAIESTQAAIDAGASSDVFISSDAAFGEQRQAVYGATKAGLIALARSVAKEYGRNGVRSNVVCPGLVVPESPDAVGARSLWSVGTAAIFNDKQRDFMLKATPLRRLTTAEDVTNAVLWLSSEHAARQVTGQVVSVSGGYAMP